MQRVADELGCWLFNVHEHFQRLLKLSLLRREERGISCDHGIYVLSCSFLILE